MDAPLQLNYNKVLMLAGAGAGGYYLLGKKPIGALVGVAVFMLLVKSGQAPMMQNVMEPEPTGTIEPDMGAPVAAGLPAPGTTADPSGGFIDPNNSTKRIGLLR